MKYEDAGCDRPCGQEPMGCSTCDMITGYVEVIPLEFDELVDSDIDYDLHDEICGVHTGYKCNCPVMVFRYR